MTFQDLLQAHRVPHDASGRHKHGRQGWVQFDCPWCGAGTGRFHCGYNPAKGSVNCWKCGKKKLTDVIMALTGLTRGAAIAAAKALPRTRQGTVAHTGRLQLPGPLGPLQAPHKAYLRERWPRWDPDHLADMWGLQALGLDGRSPKGKPLPWRIVIPIEHGGTTVSWTSRSIGERNPRRWLSAAEDEEAISHKQILFGEEYTGSSVVAVEGPTDVLAIGPGAVCTCGTAYTAAQVRLLARYARRAICFDAEPTAQRQAAEIADALACFPGETHLIQLDGGDPGSAPDSEIALIRKTFLD